MEGVSCRLAQTPEQAEKIWAQGQIPLLIDETAACVRELHPAAVIDVILAKRNLGTSRSMAPITIGAGPALLPDRMWTRWWKPCGDIFWDVLSGRDRPFPIQEFRERSRDLALNG